MKTITALRVLLYCCLALPATAQSTFAGVQMKGHPTLYVTEATGTETKGKLAGLTDAAITLRVKDVMRTFTPDELVLIERRGDSLRNGAIVGAALGSLCALLTCAMELQGGRLAAAALQVALIPLGLDAINVGRTRIWPMTLKRTKRAKVR